MLNFIPKINLRISASSWLLLKENITIQGQLKVKKVNPSKVEYTL